MLFYFTRLHTAHFFLFFHVENCQHADKKSANATIDRRSRHTINTRSTGFVPGKANECRWRPRNYQVDPWSIQVFQRRRIDNSCRLFYIPAAICFFTRRLTCAGHISLAVVCALWRYIGWVGAPNECMSPSLFLSINVRRGLGVSPLRKKLFAECFSGQCCPNIRPGFFFFVFLFE